MLLRLPPLLLVLVPLLPLLMLLQLLLLLLLPCLLLYGYPPLLFSHAPLVSVGLLILARALGCAQSRPSSTPTGAGGCPNSLHDMKE